MDMSGIMFCLSGVNLFDAHLENQHTEITFSYNCLVGVLNAHSSFHLSVQRLQKFSGRWLWFCKLEKQFEAFKTCSRLRSKIHPGVRLLGHFLGTVFGDVSKKPGFQNGTPFGPLAIETPIGGAGRGGPKWLPLLLEKRPRFWTPGKWTK
jgi:hypothetical protein